MLQADVNLAAQPLRVLVADRHEATRVGIRAAVERAGFTVVAECGDAVAATAAAVRGRADICLVDADLPGGAVDAIAAMASLPLAPKVVVLGASVDETAFLAALKAGASGYLLKDIDPARLADELRAVADGNTALAPALAVRLVEAFGTPGRRRRRPAGLTDGEWEALELLARGLSPKEIAVQLGLSATTVRRHISSSVKRLGASGRRDAAGLFTRTTTGGQLQ